MVHTIDGAMAEALSCLRLVANQFRLHGRNEAANVLGKLSIELVNTFSGAVQDLPAEAYLFNESVSAPRAKRESDGSKTTEIAMLGIHQNKYLNLPQEIQRQLGIQTSRDSLSQVPIPSLPVITTRDTLNPPQSSYVQTPIPSQDADQKPSMFTYLALPENPSPIGIVNEEERKAGVIHIHGSVFENFVRFVTARIHEGPLQEIVIESSHKTKIVFLYAASARGFFKLNEDKLAANGVSHFGAGYTVELADPIAWDDNHFMMIHPFKERRRLTFARQKLFSQYLTAQKWKRDITEIAGANNVDFLWVFNSGNATAVFTSTIIARKVLERFKKLKSSRNVYQGVDVSFSSDPCEKELHLTTQCKTPYRALEL